MGAMSRKEAKKQIGSILSYINGGNITDLSSKLFVTQKDIQSHFKDLSVYDSFNADETLKALQWIDVEVENGKGTWADYFATLGEGEKWQADFVQNNDLSKVSLEQVVEAQKKAKQGAIDYNNGLKQMTIGAKVSTLALKALSIAGNMLLSMGISWAIGKLFEGLDYLVHKTERLTENLEESVSAFEESTNELKDLNDELKTTNERITELQKLSQLGTISLIEKKELETLQETKDALERKIALEKAEQVVKYKQVVKDNQKLTNDKITSKYKMEEMEHITTGAGAPTVTWAAVTIPEELELALNRANELRNDLASGKITQEYFDNNIKDVNADINKHIGVVNKSVEGYNNLISAGYELQGESKTEYEHLQKLQNGYFEHSYNINGTVEAYKALADAKKKEIILSDLEHRGKSKEDAQAILDSMTSDDIDNYAEVKFVFVEPNRSDYNDAKSYGKAYVDAMYDGAEETSEEKIETFSPFSIKISNIQSLQSGFDILDKIYADVYDKEDFDWSSILNNKDFSDTFSRFESEYENFIRVISNNPRDVGACQEAFNDLTTAYIHNCEELNNVKEGTEGVIIAMLKQWGVANAEEMVNAQIASQNEFLAVKEKQVAEGKKENAIQSTSLADATWQEIAAVIAEGNASSDTESYLANLALAKLKLNDNPINSDEDVDNIIAIANAAGASEQYVNNLHDALQNLNNIKNNNKTLIESGNYLTTGFGLELTIGSKKQQEAQKTVDDIFADLKANINKNKLNASDYYANDYKGGSSTHSAKSSTSGSAEDAAKKALEAITGYFDWVKVRFDRLSRQTELAENAIERAVGLSAKQVSTNTAISSVRAEIEAQRAGANKYLSHANWFAGQAGLSADIQNRVKNGTIDLTKYDDITQEKISEFENYWSLYLQASDQILQLQDKEKELAQSRLENISNFYDLAISVHESLQGVNDAFLSFQETQGFSAVSDAVRKVYESSLIKAQKVYDNSLQKLNDYRSEFNSLVSQGYLQEGSDAWYEAKAEMNDFEKAVYEAGTSLQEFNDKITEISYQKIQNVIDGLERSMSKIESWISLQESRDEKIPESVYQEQLDTNNAQILQNKALRDAKLAEQALYDVNSTRYQELADDINDLDESTLSLMENNEKLKDQIFELRFSSLDEGIEKYDKLSDEIESFLGLLDEDAYFDKQGRATSELTASLALMSQKLSIYKQTIADLRVGLDKLQEAFDNGLISETEFNEKSEEYASTIRDTAVNAKELQDSLTSLYLEQMSKESEYLQDIIDKRKEALQAKADYYDYDRKVKGQRKSVSELDAQIAALQGTTNKAALSELKRLQQQRDEAQEELDETKRSHAQEMTLNGFDKISSDLDTILEDTEYAITHNADKQQSVISSMLNSVVGMYEDAYGKINSIINNTGWVGSNAFDSNQQQLGTQSGAQSQTNSALGNVSASGTANGINSSGVKDNSATNSQIESEIMQKEDITNRKVAELKVSPTAVTLEEGKSTSVTTSVRPTDAKKKQLSWNSSNTGVATVSNGTIRAVKPGTCIITVSTTDGSNIVQSIGVTVTKKPEPPKPAPKPATSTATNTPVNKDGGDGVPRVGDLVKFDNGRYYYSPDGASPTGNKKLGQKVYITKINPGSAKPYHISKGNKLGNGDLGWLRLDQLKGYRRGKNWFKKDEYAFTHNNEVIVSKDGGILRQLKQGDSVFTEKQSDNLQNWAKINPQMMFGANFTKMSTPNVSNIVNKVQPIHVENHYDSLLTVNGNVDKDVFPGVKKMCEEAFKYTTDQFTREGIKRGFRI